MSIYNEIEYILKQEKIRNLYDVRNLDIPDGRIYEKKYPWIKDICNLLKENMYKENKKMIEASDKEIIIDDLISYENTELLKYSIFFPGKTVLSAGDILLLDDGISINEKCLYNFFNSKELIKSNLVTFCPSATYYECRGGLEGAWLDKYCSDKFISIRQLNPSTQNGKNIFIGLPWLYNVEINDYIKLIAENEVEFQNYSLYLSKIWKYANGEELIRKEDLYEIKEFILHMQIMLEKSKSKIKTKTTTIILGMCFTIIPYIISQKYNFDITLLSAILGGSTVRELLDIPVEIKEMKNYNKEYSLWFIWDLFNSQK